MDTTTAVLIGLGGLVAIIAIVALILFRKGKIDLSADLKSGKVKVKAQNPTPPGANPAGVKLIYVEAKGEITALSESDGGVDIEKAKAGGSIEAKHAPGAQPPKA